MKVALATWFPRDPNQPHGGVEAVSVNLAPALARIDGLDVHVVTLDRDIQTAESYAWGDVMVHRLPQPPGSLLGFVTGAGRKLVQAYLEGLRPDVIHAHDTFGMMTRGLDLPRVFTIHGFIHEDTLYNGGVKARPRAWLWKRAELATWAEQPHIVSISPYVRERLKGISTGMIHDIENPIAPECFDVIRSDDSDGVFSAATICERKNTLGLINVAIALSESGVEVGIRLAGKVTDPAYGREVERRIREADMERKVILLGPIPAPRLRAELAKAKVFAMVSFEEGAPMGIAEAMAAGIPVVTSNCCGMPYMIRHGETGYLVRPNDVDDIAEHLGKLLTNRALREEMGERARAFARETFHPDRVAERTCAVYRRASGL